MSAAPQDSLSCLGISPATARLATFFARNGSARPTVRELQRTLGIASASAQRDLDRLVTAGALTTVVDGRALRYRTNPLSPIWPAVRLLIGDESPIAAHPGRVRESAARYGVDVGQLRSMLRLTYEQRLTQLDDDMSLIAAARSSLAASRSRRRR
jgi:hypothetical protein